MLENHIDFYLASSNPVKHREYIAYGFPYPAKKIEDIKEPLSDIYTVAAYKAQQAGIGAIVEDTALDVENVDIGVEVRFLEQTLDNYVGHKAKFQVCLAQNDGNNIKVYYAEIPGTIVKNHFPDAYGFDGNFVPDGQDKTLYELEQEGNKQKFSPRKIAVHKLLDNEFIHTVDATKKEWTGKWQNEENEEPVIKI